MRPTDFIQLMLPGAQASEKISKVPASFTIAQAALESGWGKRAPGNNLFGIKADPGWHGKTVDVPTHEYVNGIRTPVTAKFRAYDSWADSVADHVAFLTSNPRYKPAFKCIECADFTRAIAAAGYATDPNYASIINSIIQTHQLERYDSDV